MRATGGTMVAASAAGFGSSVNNEVRRGTETRKTKPLDGAALGQDPNEESKGDENAKESEEPEI